MKISQVSKIFDIPAETPRFIEREGVVHPSRSGDGHNMGGAAGGYIIGVGSMGAGSSLGKMDPVAFGDALLVNVEGEKVGPANEHYTKLYEVNISQSDGQTYSIYPADISEYSKGGTLEVMVPIITGPFYGMVHRAGTIAGLAVKVWLNRLPRYSASLS